MIIEVFIVSLLALKALSLIDISWTTTIAISLSLIAVEIQLHLKQKALLNGVLNGAKVVDDRLDDFEFRLNQKQDRAQDEDY